MTIVETYRRNQRLVAGIDEAGRGPWAGPVIAAAVILDPDRVPKTIISAIDDSKTLSPAVRERLFAELAKSAGIGVGEATVEEIDALNILQATLLAMVRATEALGIVPDLAIVDGRDAPPLPCPTHAIIRGDASHKAIGAASIVAKVTRDALMRRLAGEFPGYGWERNMGYGTAEHRAALLRLGVTPHHRRSFRPIRQVLAR